jgi:undecaprenyl diphosphate synthase
MIGNRDSMPSDIVPLIEKAEEKTKNNDALHVQVALSYSGRFDLLQAVQKIAHDVEKGEIKAQSIDDNAIESRLLTCGVVDPDLLIRTSGELRISNFLLWQCAYSELYFTDTLWPDFQKEDLIKAIESYTKRDRRFGGINEKAS